MFEKCNLCGEYKTTAYVFKNIDTSFNKGTLIRMCGNCGKPFMDDIKSVCSNIAKEENER